MHRNRNEQHLTVKLKRGERVELEIEKFADRGKSLARRNGYVIFVRGAVPGDRVMARIGKATKSYAEAHLEELIQPSTLRTKPRCFYFGTCGGCKWQHVDYSAQLEAKTRSVQDALAHTGGFREIDIRPAIASDNDYFYRNKMEFSFSASRWLTREEIDSGDEFDTDFALGLHVPGHFDKVLDLHECHLQSELSAALVNGVRRFAKSRGWEPWHVRRHTGYLRHLVIRTGERTGDVMVNLVTSNVDEERTTELSGFLQEEFPEVTTFVNTINRGTGQTALGDETRVIFGPGVIYDRIGPYTFEIAPTAFFQTNTAGAEHLYEITRRFADLRTEDVVYDLYCGAGTISIFVAKEVSRVVGIELVEEAVDNARANALANGIDNCVFEAGDMLKVFDREFVGRHGQPDVLIVDPPRAGMHPKVVERIAATGPNRLVYVSCNPQTQARDIKMMADRYRPVDVQPVDLFPHTHHIENVVKLARI